MRIRAGLLVVSLLCFLLAADRPAIASNVQATAWTWGWGCSLDSQTQSGSTTATASANCVDTLGSGAQSSSYVLVTRDPKTPLDTAITINVVSSSSNGDNTWAGATGSWSESVMALGGIGQGLLFVNDAISGSTGWGGYGVVDEVCLTGTVYSYCYGDTQFPYGLVDIIPFTFGQSFEVTTTLEADVAGSWGWADASLELGPSSYWFTDVNFNPIYGASLEITPEPVTLVLLGTGLLALGARVGRSRFRSVRR